MTHSFPTLRSSDLSSLITKRLIEFARSEFRLDWEGIHGVPHWSRVRYNGLQLAEQTGANRSEEHTSELQSLMRISYAVFCLKKKTTSLNTISRTYHT